MRTARQFKIKADLAGADIQVLWSFLTGQAVAQQGDLLGESGDIQNIETAGHAGADDPVVDELAVCRGRPATPLATPRIAPTLPALQSVSQPAMVAISTAQGIPVSRERAWKFLTEIPDFAAVEKFRPVKSNIVQTYLPDAGNTERRIRQCGSGGNYASSTRKRP